MVGILWVNWKIARFVLNDNSNRGGGGFIKREWVPYLTWGFNIVVLFANEIYGGYEFGKVFEILGWLVSIFCLSLFFLTWLEGTRELMKAN